MQMKYSSFICGVLIFSSSFFFAFADLGFNAKEKYLKEHYVGLWTFQDATSSGFVANRINSAQAFSVHGLGHGSDWISQNGRFVGMTFSSDADVGYLNSSTPIGDFFSGAFQSFTVELWLKPTPLTGLTDFTDCSSSTDFFGNFIIGAGGKVSSSDCNFKVQKTMDKTTFGEDFNFGLYNRKIPYYYYNNLLVNDRTTFCDVSSVDPSAVEGVDTLINGLVNDTVYSPKTFGIDSLYDLEKLVHTVASVKVDFRSIVGSQEIFQTSISHFLSSLSEGGQDKKEYTETLPDAVVAADSTDVYASLDWRFQHPLIFGYNGENADQSFRGEVYAIGLLDKYVTFEDAKALYAQGPPGRGVDLQTATLTTPDIEWNVFTDDSTSTLDFSSNYVDHDASSTLFTFDGLLPPNVVFTQLPAHGTVAVDGFVVVVGQEYNFTESAPVYTPERSFSGTDSLQYHYLDLDGFTSADGSWELIVVTKPIDPVILTSQNLLLYDYLQTYTLDVEVAYGEVSLSDYRASFVSLESNPYITAVTPTSTALPLTSSNATSATFAIEVSVNAYLPTDREYLRFNLVLCVYPVADICSSSVTLPLTLSRSLLVTDLTRTTEEDVPYVFDLSQALSTTLWAPDELFVVVTAIGGYDTTVLTNLSSSSPSPSALTFVDAVSQLPLVYPGETAFSLSYPLNANSDDYNTSLSMYLYAKDAVDLRSVQFSLALSLVPVDDFPVIDYSGCTFDSAQRLVYPVDTEAPLLDCVRVGDVEGDYCNLFVRTTGIVMRDNEARVDVTGYQATNISVAEINATLTSMLFYADGCSEITIEANLTEFGNASVHSSYFFNGRVGYPIPSFSVPESATVTPSIDGVRISEEMTIQWNDTYYCGDYDYNVTIAVVSGEGLFSLSAQASRYLSSISTADIVGLSAVTLVGELRNINYVFEQLLLVQPASGTTVLCFTGIDYFGTPFVNASLTVNVEAEDDESSSTALVVGGGAAVVVACGAIVAGALIMKRNKKAVFKVLPPPDFTPYVYGEPEKYTLSSKAEEFANKLTVFESTLVEPESTLLQAVLGLTQVCEADKMASSLVTVLEDHDVTLRVIRARIVQEVSDSEGPSTLFRTNSIATKLIKSYAKMIGLPYLYQAIASPIQELAFQSEDIQLEVDPNKASQDDNIRVNKFSLMAAAQKLLDSILKSFSEVPSEFRAICYHLRKEVTEKYPDNEPAKYNAVGGFMFLRFICPAIMAPESFGLLPAPPTDSVRRQLVLLAKTLQNVANGVEFKESHMENLNMFIRMNRPEFEKFLDDLAVAPAEGSGAGVVSGAILDDDPLGTRGSAAVTSGEVLIEMTELEDGETGGKKKKKSSAKEKEDMLAFVPFGVKPTALIYLYRHVHTMMPQIHKAYDETLPDFVSRIQAIITEVGPPFKPQDKKKAGAK